MKKLILLGALAALSALLNTITAAAHASDVNALTCTGCSEAQRQGAIRKAGHEGTVYVFDSKRASVHKYAVSTEVISARPYTAFTAVEKRQAEPDLAAAYGDFISSLELFTEDGRIILPDNFPIRSVAGALFDPAYTSTSIEDHLRQMALLEQVQNNLTTLVLRLMKVKIPIVDSNLLVDAVIFTAEFPDGSTMDFVVSISVNSMTGEAKAEVESHGNARLADGSPAPTSALGFRGQEFNDEYGSLFEWIMLARLNGVSIVTGRGGRGTTSSRMVCYVRGPVVTCSIIGSR